MTLKEAISEIEKRYDIENWDIQKDIDSADAVRVVYELYHGIMEILRRHEKDEPQYRFLTKEDIDFFEAVIREQRGKTCVTCKYNDSCEINWELQKVAENNKPIYCSEWEAKP